MINVVKSFIKLWPSFRYAFRPHKPILILRLAKAFILARVFKIPRLRYVDMSLNLACNMECEHCFATAFEPKSKKTPKLAVEDYGRIADEAMRLGAVNFSFQGGEPLLLKNLPDYIRAVKPWKNIVSVTTNASLLDREKIRSLKKAGVDILTISIDSMNPEEHDSFRHMKGSHAKALAAIDDAIAEGLHITIGATLSHQNIRSEGIRGLIDFAQSKKIILCFNMATQAGNWAHRDDVLLTEEDSAIIREWEEKYQYVRTDFEANLCQRGCGAVKEILYVTPFGDVLACPFIHVSLGNAAKESLNRIRNRALGEKYFAEYAQKCLCAEDKEFMDKFIRPASAKGLLSGFDAFGWKREDGADE